MDNNLDFTDLIQSIADKSLRLAQHLKPNIDVYASQATSQASLLLELSNDYLACVTAWTNNPMTVQKLQTDYWYAAMNLWQEQLHLYLDGKSMPIDEKRFNRPEWVNNPWFNILTQQYLLAKKHTLSIIEAMDFGPEPQRAPSRVAFYARQYLDALSPDNFIQTNPELLAETIKSQGVNLLRGLDNLLSDLSDDGMSLTIRMTDKQAFTLGENLAATPGQVIYRNELMELIQYTPQTAQVKSVPLLIVPPWINKYYILDLSAHNSLIRWLVEQKITVFVISWVNPDARYAHKTLSDYLIEGPIAALDVIKNQLNVKQVNTLGFCIGGTLLSMCLAYHAARHDTSIRSATFLASLIDFSDPGDVSVFIDEAQIANLETVMQRRGYLEGRLMATAFNSLRASDLVWSFFIKNYLYGLPSVPFDVFYWNMDNTNMPSTMHSQYLRWMYLNNDLIKPGKVVINNTPLDISKITAPVFFVSTKRDHIAPWKTTYIGFDCMQGPKQFLLGGAGHIAGIIIPPGGEKYGYYTNTAAPHNPDEWLASAHYHLGSWWPTWLSWLQKQSGRLVKAPVLQALPMQSLGDAPGTYILKATE